jgi:hypothetical protein
LPYGCESPHYRVAVHGGFVDDDRWLVYGEVAFGRAISPETRPGIADEARHELMIGIAREVQRARRLGAHRVVVLVDGDPEAAEFFEEIDGRRDKAGPSGGRPLPPDSPRNRWDSAGYLPWNES